MSTRHSLHESSVITYAQGTIWTYLSSFGPQSTLRCVHCVPCHAALQQYTARLRTVVVLRIMHSLMVNMDFHVVEVFVSVCLCA